VQATPPQREDRPPSSSSSLAEKGSKIRGVAARVHVLAAPAALARSSACSQQRLLEAALSLPAALARSSACLQQTLLVCSSARLQQRFCLQQRLLTAVLAYCRSVSSNNSTYLQQQQQHTICSSSSSSR